MSRQCDRLVDASRAENFTAAKAVRLLHLLRERRRTGTDGGAAKAFPVKRHRVDLVVDLIHFGAVGFRHCQVGKRKFGGLERMIVVSGLKFTQLLVVVVEFVVGEVFASRVLQETRAVALKLFGGL